MNHTPRHGLKDNSSEKVYTRLRCGRVFNPSDPPVRHLQRTGRTRGPLRVRYRSSVRSCRCGSCPVSLPSVCAPGKPAGAADSGTRPLGQRRGGAFVPGVAEQLHGRPTGGSTRGPGPGQANADGHRGRLGGALVCVAWGGEDDHG